MRLWHGVALGVGAYLLFMIVTAPAARVLPWVQPEGVQLAGLEGSLWSGSAALVTATPVQLQDLHWQLQPFALLLGRAEARLEARLEGRPVSARVGEGLFGSPYMADVNATVAASDLLRWLRLNQVAADGNLTLELSEVQWPAGTVPALTGTAAWSPARVSAPVELSLGTVRLATEAQDGITAGKLTSSGGALLVDGEVQLQPDGAYRLDARIRQEGDVPDAVGQFLTTFAEYNDGLYRLEWADSLLALQ
ncbi:MAG: type II secretion system protein N [Gammaproteobacteria bacterium]|jgi:general secretion pathway protein N